MGLQHHAHFLLLLCIVGMILSIRASCLRKLINVYTEIETVVCVCLVIQFEKRVFYHCDFNSVMDEPGGKQGCY